MNKKLRYRITRARRQRWTPLLLHWVWLIYLLVLTPVVNVPFAERCGLGLQERVSKPLIGLFPQLAELVQVDVERLQQKLADDDGQERDQLMKQLSTRLEWLKRLQDWKSYSPEAGRPWLVWVTLYLVSKDIGGARAVLTP